MKFGRKHLLFVAIFALGFVVRFYSFTDRIDFSLDSSQDLILAAQVARDRKLTLIGPPVGSRVIDGIYYYIGPAYVYILALLELLTAFDPVLITACFALLNISFGVMVWGVVRKKFPRVNANLVFFYYMLHPLMVRLSLSIWNPMLNLPIILTSILLFPRHATLLGILSGIGVGFHFSYLVPATLIALALMLHQKRNVLLYLAGMIIGELPWILFELRHSFHNSKALVRYFGESLSGNSNTHLSSIDFVWAWPLLLVGVSMWVQLLYRWQKAAGYMLASAIALYALYAIFLAPKDLTTFGMPDGWTIKETRTAAAIIANDSPPEFAVASLIKGDTRDYPLRYYLEYIFGTKPVAVEAYPHVRIQYVVARGRDQVSTSTVWELTSPGPHVIEKVWPLANSISLYKLRFPHAVESIR